MAISGSQPGRCVRSAFLIAFATQFGWSATCLLPPTVPQSCSLAFEHDRYDLGVMRSGSSRSFHVLLRNTGVLPARIIEVTASCGCVVLESPLADFSLAPAQSVSIPLTVEAPERPSAKRQGTLIVEYRSDVAANGGSCWCSVEVTSDDTVVPLELSREPTPDPSLTTED